MEPNTRSFLSPKSVLKLWAGLFTGHLFLGLFIQLVLLPYGLPSLHWGHGLLVGGDWTMFHSQAVLGADRIIQEGLRAWEPRTAGTHFVGIMSLFYGLLTPEPYALQPFLSLVHSGACTLLFLILFRITQNQSAAFFGALLYFIFPSTVSWSVMPQKDSVPILGSFLFFWAWVRLASFRSSYSFKSWAWTALVLLGSAWVIWFVRPYQVEVLAIANAAFLVLFLFFKTVFEKWGFKSLLPIIALGVFQLYCMTHLPKTEVIATPISTSLLEYQASLKTNAQTDTSEAWEPVAWLGQKVNQELRTLASARRGFIVLSDVPGAANVGAEYGFHNPWDVLKFIPKALVIAHLTPFPTQWTSANPHVATSSIQRRLSGLEMAFVYFSLFFLPWSLWYWRKNLAVWILFVGCEIPLLLQGLVIVNTGTLYRLRYGFLMALVGLSIAGLWVFVQKAVLPLLRTKPLRWASA